MATRTISNWDDVIDSRDVIERIQELRDERESLVDAEKEARAVAEQPAETEEERAELDEALKTASAELVEWDDDNGDELKALEALAEEAEGYSEDWEYGATLVRESYFTDYCEELVKDIGDLPKKIPFYIEIDWEKTADNLRVDYTEVDYDGVTYLVR